MTSIYLDNAATTCPLPEVVDAMLGPLRRDFGNPSSIHIAGEAARRQLEEARSRVAALLRARETELVFTAGATESINAALRGCLEAAPPLRRRLVTTSVEHEATVAVCQHLERNGVDVVVVPVDSRGCLDLERLRQELERPTALLSLMMANNETGVLFPVEEAAAMARSAGAAVHLDAVQAVGKVPLDVERLGVDMLSLSAHKFHGPKGVGVLYLRRGARFVPFLLGAPHEGGRRAGTENVPAIAGAGVAASHMGDRIPWRREHLSHLSRLLEEHLLKLPETRLNGDPEGRVPGIVNISFRGIEGAAVVLTAAREGVCLSAGSACGAARFGGSHVLEAMGVPYEYLHGAVRFSLAETTTEEEVRQAIEVVTRAVDYLRSMEPGSRAVS